MDLPNPTTLALTWGAINLVVALAAIRRARRNSRRVNLAVDLASEEIARLRWNHLADTSTELRRQLRRERSVTDRLLGSASPAVLDPRAAAAAGEPFDGDTFVMNARTADAMLERAANDLPNVRINNRY